MDMTVKPEKPTPRPGVMDIHPYVPGESGDGNSPVIKLASNESPLGPSPRVREALMAALDDIGLYPDGSATALRQELGRVYGLDPDLLVAGNGSEQLIAYLAQIYAGPGDEIIQSEFGFIAYRIATLAAGADLVVAPEKNYTSDVDAILAAVTQKTKTVFLANPNNPTGTYITGAEVKRLRARLPSHILLVLDAAYSEYVEKADYDPGDALVDTAIASGAENVAVLRTFSKIYGLAAKRIGWCYAPPSVVDALHRVRGAFNVGTLAQVAGVAALRDQDHVAKVRALNNAELPRVSAALEAMGLPVLPSVGNFVLAKFPDGKAQDAFLNLKKCGIILRPVAGYGLAEFLRITLGAKKHNDAMLEALENYLKKTS